jgi:hypothetical protein
MVGGVILTEVTIDESNSPLTSPYSAHGEKTELSLK